VLLRVCYQYSINSVIAQSLLALNVLSDVVNYTVIRVSVCAASDVAQALLLAVVVFIQAAAVVMCELEAVAVLSVSDQ
jgi:hypothetical protein